MAVEFGSCSRLQASHGRARSRDMAIVFVFALGLSLGIILLAEKFEQSCIHSNTLVLTILSGNMLSGNSTALTVCNYKALQERVVTIQLFRNVL